MGAYGFLRFSLPMFPFATVFFTPLIFVLSLIATIYASLTTLRQVDLKKLLHIHLFPTWDLLLLGFLRLMYKV